MISQTQSARMLTLIIAIMVAIIALPIVSAQITNVSLFSPSINYSNTAPLDINFSAESNSSSLFECELYDNSTSPSSSLKTNDSVQNNTLTMFSLSSSDL
ncbi:MAG: hypothetical protein ACQESC_00375, partial [Nanobdellota archaeon]